MSRHRAFWDSHPNESMVTTSSVLSFRSAGMPIGSTVRRQAGSQALTAEPLPATTADFRQFTGQELDTETGLDFFQARYLASGLGRFLSPDPGNAGADFTNPQSWNGYGYVLGNPLNSVDPSGLVGIQPQPQPIVPASPVQGVPTNCAWLASIYMANGPVGGSLPYGCGGSGPAISLSVSPFPVPSPSSSATTSVPPKLPTNLVYTNPDGSTVPLFKTCVGTRAHGLAGNPAYVTNTPLGGASRNWGVHPSAGTAAVIPLQFGFTKSSSMVPFIGSISGSVGGNTFTTIADVIGSNRRSDVRSFFSQQQGGQLVIEIPGGKDTSNNAFVSLAVPSFPLGLPTANGCPSYTTPGS